MMKMNRKIFDEMYDDVLARWPRYIKVKKIIDNNSFMLSGVVDIHDKIEDELSDEMQGDEFSEDYYHWKMNIDWEINVAIRTAAEFVDIVYPHKINREDVLERCIANKDFTDSWIG